MKPLLHGIKRRAIDLLSLDRMSDKFLLLSANYIFLMFYTTLESVFVNTLLYRISSDMTTVIYYRSITYVITSLSMHLAAYLTQKRGPVLVMRVGSVLYFSTYFVLCVGMDHMAALKYFVAVLSGLGAGFYWTGHNFFLAHSTTRGNRDVGMSILGMIQGVVTLFCPVLSGFVIAYMPGGELTGYRVMFVVGMLAVLGQIVCEARLERVPGTQNKSGIRAAWGHLRRLASCRWMLLFEFLRGMRDGAFAFVLNMILFEIVTDESVVGINTFLTGAMAIFGSWLFGKIITARNRAWAVMLATTVLLATCSLLFFYMNVGTVILFAVINAFLQLFILYSANNTSYDVVSQSGETRSVMSEIMAFRENFMAAGRLSGLVIMLIMATSQVGYVRAMFLLTLLQYLVGIIIRFIRIAPEEEPSC